MRPPPIQSAFDGLGLKAWQDWFLEVYRSTKGYQGSGTTAERPTDGLEAGDRYYDTDLGVMVYWSGSAWVDTRDAVLTESYTSTAQTITSAGSLTLAHGLTGVPTLIQLRLKCTSAEYGYSIDDEVIVNVAATDAATNSGVSVALDGTNINIRFGSHTNAFYITNKTSGNNQLATNANWNLIVKAWR